MKELEGYSPVISVSMRRDGRRSASAQVAELPGCIAEGSTEQEALKRLVALLPEYLAALRRIGAPIPEPHPLGILAHTVRFGKPMEDADCAGPSQTGEHLAHA